MPTNYTRHYSPKCWYLDVATGETLPCVECNGTTQVPVLKCRIHGECSEEKLVNRPGERMLACCRSCGDRSVEESHQLVVTADGIGDHVMALSVAAGWRRSHPNCRLVMVARSRWVELFADYDDLLLQDKPLSRVAHAWQASTNGDRYFVERVADLPSSERAVPTLRHLPDDALTWSEQFRGCAILAPWVLGKNTTSRQWLMSHWHMLEIFLKEEGRRVVVIGDEKAEQGSFTSRVLRNESPQRVAALMGVASCVVSNESGMAHLAGALGVPTVVLSAQLDATHVYGLWTSVHVIRGPLGCSGCRWRGLEWRPRCDTICASLQAITPEVVLDEVLRLRPGRVLPAL
jgi:ADP-heptose:LPS heptosyltransferase